MIQENDYIIKPVDNLPNVGALSPVDQRKEKRKRQGARQGRTTPADRQDLSDTEPDGANRPGDKQTGPGSIDYRA
jgi:hypothetical protein